LLLLLGAGFAGGSILSTEAGLSITGNRVAQVKAESDPNGLIQIVDSDNTQDTGLDGTKVYKEPHQITITNATDYDLTGNNKIESSNGDLRFRDTGSSTSGDQTRSIVDLYPSDSTDIEILTAPDRSGKVTDTVTLQLEGSSGFFFETQRAITVEFKSNGQLIYAVNEGDIKVYDAVSDTLHDPPQTKNADAVGARAADIVGDSNADIPYLNENENEDVYATTVGKSSDTAIDKGQLPQLKKQETRVALRKWPPANLSGNLMLVADNNSSRIIGIDGSGNTETIAVPPNGCDGVAGVNDIDGDGADEMVFADSSQEMRYLEQDGTTVKIENGGVGFDKSTGFGPPADFDGDGVPRVPIIDGSNNPAVVTADGNKTVLNPNGIAKKAGIAPVDIDGDGVLEFMYLDSSSGKIKYIDDVLGSNKIETLLINGSTVTPLERVGLNTQAD
jgi:hypothetical protein